MSSGFSKLREKKEGQQGGQVLDLSSFKPATNESLRIPDDDALADKVAVRHSLPAEPVGRVPLQRPVTTRDRLFINATMETCNRFRIYCNEHNLEFGPALKQLLDIADRMR